MRARLLRDTVALRWEDIEGSEFDPEEHRSPVIPVKADRGGDGTVPFWSARLASSPPAQVYDLREAKRHQELTEHLETLKVTEHVIQNGRLPAAPLLSEDRRLGARRSSQAKATELVEDVALGRIEMSDPRAQDPATWRRLMEDMALC